ncbi:MAG: hypothetical protein V4501_07745 [Pseudomonadota bacterium]
MKKFTLILTSAGILLTNPVFAESPVTLTCPTTITCHADTGLCDVSAEWTVNVFNARENFEGTKTLSLTEIAAVKFMPPNYLLMCNYIYSADYSSITLQADVAKLTGANWLYGFGKQTADCSTEKDPSQCTGEN